MVLNRRVIIIVLFSLLILILGFLAYSIFFSESPVPVVDKLLKSVGLKPQDDSESGPAVPLPRGFGGGGGGGGGGSGGGGGGAGASGGEDPGSSEEVILHFCTFDAFHIVNGVAPCRCGLTAVCAETGLICDATFDNGQGTCG